MSERLLETARMIAAKEEFLIAIDEWKFEEHEVSESRIFVSNLISELLKEIPHYKNVWQHISMDDLPTELALFIPPYYKEIRIVLKNIEAMQNTPMGWRGNHISLESEHFGTWGLDFMVASDETRMSVYVDRYSTEDATRFALTRGHDEEFLLATCASLCKTILLKDGWIN